MRRPMNVYAFVAFVCLGIFGVQFSLAQGYDTPLTMQSLNQTTAQSAASRGAGGIIIGIHNDVSLMFMNPAMLQTLDRIQVSVGAINRHAYTKQDQLYGGSQSHSALLLLAEGVTGLISDPDSIPRAHTTTPIASDTVQRPFDDLGPNWNRTKAKMVPIQAFVGVPFEIEGMKIVAGLGFIEYANLTRYYQNNNCWSPTVLGVLNGTIGTGSLNTTPYLSQWFQYCQQRDGSIYGYGGALSVGVLDNLSFGASAVILSGTTDDFEKRFGRGLMTFYQTYLRLSKNGMTSYTKTGTSKFKGAELTIGTKYTGKHFEIGLAVKPPMTITRTYNSIWNVDSVTAVSRIPGTGHRVDSLHATWSTSVAGEDRMKMPWRGNIGISMKVGENLKVGLGYEIHMYDLAEYTASNGTVDKPWASAQLWRVGAEYTAADWLTLRGGAYEDAEAYEPTANALRGEAPKHTMYTLGVGIGCEGIHLNVAYEYGVMRYTDTWSNAASVNTEMRSNIVADISYELPFGF
jgi:long-subunit fatty acid transport protein